MMEWNMKNFQKLSNAIRLLHYPTKLKYAFGFLLHVYLFL